MLDDAVIHVANVERAVGAGGEVHGPKALVGRSDELAALVSLARAERAALRGDDVALDEITCRLADKRVAIKRGGEKIAAIDPRRARRGELLQFVIAQHLRDIAAVDARIDAGGP